MSSKRILSIGFELASPDVEDAELRSKTSLLDWDIVLFRPEIEDFITSSAEYHGKPSLDDSDSFQLKESCEHWRREIKQAVESGKTVIVFLPPLQEIYVATGQRTYSGTGRNQRTTRHVTGYDNYQSIPATLMPLASSGAAMKLAAHGVGPLAPYWREFENLSQYQVLLTAPDVPACVLTRAGDKVVGALYRERQSSGALLLLPDIDFYADDFLTQKGDEQDWTAAAKRFAGRMVSAVVSIDKTLRNSAALTPEPTWASAPTYALSAEKALRLRLLEAEQAVEAAQRQKERLADELKAAGAYRALLFEKGKPLETAIIEALRLLGFAAAPFKESDSEFDVVFESESGRLIGEAEGKDSKAINIDKLRQLSMNIYEDLQRDTVSVPAKPVLFGNGYRLRPLTERPDPFTEKCHHAAASSSTALVFTPDLFAVVQYLLSNANPAYARACRQMLLTSVGRVAFPALPPAEQPSEEVRVEKTR